jgi:hypothetical protein
MEPIRKQSSPRPSGRGERKNKRCGVSRTNWAPVSLSAECS